MISEYRIKIKSDKNIKEDDIYNSLWKGLKDNKVGMIDVKIVESIKGELNEIIDMIKDIEV